MVNKYKKMLEHKYQIEKMLEHKLRGNTLSKLEFIGDSIFEFITYDDGASEVLAKNMLEVIAAISNQLVSRYIKRSKRNMTNYYTMINTTYLNLVLDSDAPYATFSRKIGRLIRGTYPEYNNNDNTIDIEIGEMPQFFIALLEWVNNKPTKYTKAEIIAELKRELGMRYGVYTKAVKGGRMTEADKNKKIGLMQAAIDIIVGAE